MIYSVGVGGHVLHGGYGLSSHTYGLLMDSLIEVSLVLANSSVVTASASQNPDLFWALRGAGSSFGIVTNFKFNTFAAPNSNLVYLYTFSWNEQQARSAVGILQNYVNTTMPAEMNMRFEVYTSMGTSTTSLRGVYYGAEAAFQTAIAPLLAELGSPASTNVTTEGWIDTLLANANTPLETPLDYDVVRCGMPDLLIELC